jgi:cytoskeletal protein RodZ
VPPEQHHTAAVFVNQSGRRRKLIMIGSIASSVLVLALLAFVIGGMFSSTTLSVNGWPGDRSDAADSTASPDRTPTPRPKLSEQPMPSVTRPAVTRSPSGRPSTTGPARSSATPQPERTTPQPARTSAAPSPDATAEPTTDPTDAGTEPPGQDKTPPGLDPNRTKGPKK